MIVCIEKIYSLINKQNLKAIIYSPELQGNNTRNRNTLPNMPYADYLKITDYFKSELSRGFSNKNMKIMAGVNALLSVNSSDF